MRLLMLIIFVLASGTINAQLSKKELKKLEEYENELLNGDTYKANKKAVKLLKKHPEESSVIDFKIRCTIKLYKGSLKNKESFLVEISSRILRHDYFKELIKLIQKGFQVNSGNTKICTYILFLNNKGKEKPYDAGDTRALNEMYSNDLKQLNNRCN